MNKEIKSIICPHGIEYTQMIDCDRYCTSLPETVCGCGHTRDHHKSYGGSGLHKSGIMECLHCQCKMFMRQNKSISNLKLDDKLQVRKTMYGEYIPHHCDTEMFNVGLMCTSHGAHLWQCMVCKLIKLGQFKE